MRESGVPANRRRVDRAVGGAVEGKPACHGDDRRRRVGGQWRADFPGQRRIVAVLRPDDARDAAGVREGSSARVGMVRLAASEDRGGAAERRASRHRRMEPHASRLHADHPERRRPARARRHRARPAAARIDLGSAVHGQVPERSAARRARATAADGSAAALRRLWRVAASRRRLVRRIARSCHRRRRGACDGAVRPLHHHRHVRRRLSGRGLHPRSARERRHRRRNQSGRNRGV